MVRMPGAGSPWGRSLRNTPPIFTILNGSQAQVQLKNVTEEGTEMLPMGQDADTLDKVAVSVL